MLNISDDDLDDENEDILPMRRPIKTPSFIQGQTSVKWFLIMCVCVLLLFGYCFVFLFVCLF